MSSVDKTNNRKSKSVIDKVCQKAIIIKSLSMSNLVSISFVSKNVI